MATSIHSFGYKSPPALSLGQRLKAKIIDVRDWPNPYRIEQLRFMCGLDGPVIDFIKASLGSSFDDKFLTLVTKVTNARGAVYLGCQGGRHRSVFLAEAVGKLLGLPITHHNLISWRTKS